MGARGVDAIYDIRSDSGALLGYDGQWHYLAMADVAA